MGITKSEIFTDHQNEIALFAKVLGHPARVAILQHLFKINACVCGDLVDEIGLAQPTISQHLKELKNAEIIQGTIEGKSIKYCINKSTIKKFEQYIDLIFHKMEKKETGCC